MKGSSGWVVIGVLVIFTLFFTVRVFYQDAVAFKLKHQNIVFGELEILRAKGTLLLAEKSLNVTWNLSSLRQIFDSAQGGFGSEFWYRINPSSKTQIGKIPSNDEIKTHLASLSQLYKGYDGVEDIEGIKLRTEITPVFTLEDNKITVQVLGDIKTFVGDEIRPATESPKAVDYTYVFLVQFKKLMDAGKSFVQKASTLTIPSYADDANTYKSRAENSITDRFNDVSTDLNKAFELERTRIIVPTSSEAGILPALTGLLFYYKMKGQFTEKQALYHYLDENTFEKKPFSLAVKAEDYLVALNCANNNGLFTFAAANDMVCDGGKIFTCDTIIDGIGNNLLTCANGVGQSTGTFGCGENRFKTSSAVDESSCYCTAFGGTWLPAESWSCPKQITTCVKVMEKQDDKEVEIEKCTTTTIQVPRSCRAECTPRNQCPFAVGDCNGI